MNLKKELKIKYSRDNENKKSWPKTVSLTELNHRKLSSLNIFLSKFINDYLNDYDSKYLKREFSKKLILAENKNRIVTSVSIRSENLEKLEGVNLTLLVNTLLDAI